MKTIYKKTQMLFIIFMLTCTIDSIAQSTIKNSLITNLITHIDHYNRKAPDYNNNNIKLIKNIFSSETSGTSEMKSFSLNTTSDADQSKKCTEVFSSEKADFFFITFQIDGMKKKDEIETVLSFGIKDSSNLHDDVIFLKFSIKNGFWIIQRKYNDGWVDYRSYDNIGFNGKFTIMVSKNNIGIAKDDGDEKWLYAPIFFGLNSTKGLTLNDQLYDDKEYFFNLSTNINPTILFNTSYVKGVEVEVENHKYRRYASIFTLNYIDGAGKYHTDIKFYISSILNKDKTQELFSNFRIKTPTQDIKEVATATSIQNGIKVEQLILYPNPTSRHLKVETPLEIGKSIRLQIINTNGGVVHQETYRQDATPKLITLPNTLKTGAYIILVQGEKYNATAKFIFSNSK